MNLDLSVSSIQETVTVTGETPLLDTASSTIGTNIDPRQVEELPINGRNWMDLTMSSAGSRSNSSSEVPQDRQGYFQTNVDGQSVTLTVCCAQNQPRYSKDSIAEFQLTTNRFDATQGRTMGMMVNAVTKSGTNIYAGSFGAYFRNDAWNAADFIQKTVLPYKDQQVQRYVWRTDRQGQGPLLRKLRVREQPADVHVRWPQRPLPERRFDDQPEHGRQVQHQAGRCEG